MSFDSSQMIVFHIRPGTKLVIFIACTQVTKGFFYWKDATVAFKKHVQSKSHNEAVEVVVILPKTTKDVGEQLSRAHRADKEQARDIL